MPAKDLKPAPVYTSLHKAISEVLHLARNTTVRAINTVMTAAYWEIGRQLVEFEQRGKERAEYGSQLISRLAKDLTAQFGRGFSADNLELMRLFYITYPINKISESPIRKLKSSGIHDISESLIRKYHFDSLMKMFPLSWTHYIHLMRRCSLREEREFYEAEALRGGWSVRTLDRQIATQFYQRGLLSHNKVATLKKEAKAKTSEIIAPEEAIRDPYILEFLDLKDEYSELELEAALINKLENFMLELGDNFAFIGRQRRLRIGHEWYRVDLVFFNRQLKSLIIIDLKLGKFTHADVGQMHLYLNYAKEHWMKEGENPPIGLILCTQKDQAVAHYALEGLPNKIMASEYKLSLPNEKKLAAELAKAHKFLSQHKK